MFKVFNRKKNQVDLLENPISPVIVNELGGIGELTFSVPSTYKHLELEGYIQVENDHEYVIKEIVTHGTNRDVVCMLNIEEILGMAWSKFISRDNTLMKCAELVLSGTKWRAIDKSSCKVKRNLYGTVTNSYNLLQMMCTVYNVEFIFDTYNKTVTFVDKVGKDAGVYFINDINLKQLNVDTHTHKYITRVIPVGKDGLTIESVNNGKNYLENKTYTTKNIYGIWQSDKHDDPKALMEDAKRFLDEMAVPYETYEVVVDDLYALKGYDDFKYGLGDIVTIIDGDTETRIQQRVIQRTYNLLEPDKDTIHIANKDATFEDYYKRLQTIADMTQSVIGSDGSINGGNISDGTISGDKIEDDSINSDHISSGSITSTHIKAEQILADHIMANQITTNHLVAESITSDHIQSNSIDTKHLKANIITSDHIQSDTINSNHISANTITSGHIQSGAITAGSGIIADGAIGNAQISKIDAGKIEAGTIDTSKVTIQGANGHLRLKGNRMQVFQGVGNRAKERVSVGDVNGDGTVYGLRVRGADGQTILLDENGVTSEGITDGSITNDKINEDANIDGAKLNINSVINKINTDGTEVIQGTKIEVNGTNLGVKLSEITSKQTSDGEKITQAQSQIIANQNAIKLKVDEQTYTTDKKSMTSKLEKNTSEISTMKGQIALKVEQTDINNAKNEINNSVDTKISSAKSELKVTTDGISQKVGKLETTTTTLSGKVDKANTNATDAKNTANTANSNANQALTQITTTNNRLSSIESNVNGITSRVSNVENKQTTVGGKVSSLESRMSTAESKITDNAITNVVKKSFYSKSDIDSKNYQSASQVQQTVDGLEMKFQQSGGYNLLYNGDFRRGTDKWAVTNGFTTSTGSGNYSSPDRRGVCLLGQSGKAGYVSQNLSSEHFSPVNFNLSGYVYVTSSGTDDSSGVTFHYYVRLSYDDGTMTYHRCTWDKTVYNKWHFVELNFARDTSKTLTEIRVSLAIQNTTRKIYLSQAMLSQGTAYKGWSPNPNEVYDGITTIDKDGITVTASNVKSKTNMSASGFKITKTDTNEDVFKVNSDGTLSIKGQITVTGGSVPTANLTGTISSNQLNSSITSDINNAKNNASSAKSTADSAKSTADTAKSTADSAKSTATSAQSTANTANTNATNALNTANSVNNTLNSNKLNWTNAYNRVNEWAYDAVTGSTTIDGGYLQANTVVANKLAVGDFNNYATVNEYIKESMLPTTFKYGGTAIRQGSNQCISSSSTTKQYLMMCDFTRTTFKQNDEILVEGYVYSHHTETKNIYANIWGYDADKSHVCGASFAISVPPKTWTKVKGTIKLTDSRWGTNSIVYHLVGFNMGSDTTISKDIDIWARGFTFCRKSTGELIVDGAITANKIATGAITANMITSGTLDTNKISIQGGTTRKVVVANDNYCVYDGAISDVNRKVFMGFRTNTATNVPSVMLGYNGINPAVDGAVVSGGTYTTYSHYPNNNNPEDINQSYGALAFKYGASGTQFSTLNMYQNGDIDLKAGSGIYFRPSLRNKNNHVFGMTDKEVGSRVPFKCTSTIYSNGDITTDKNIHAYGNISASGSMSCGTILPSNISIGSGLNINSNGIYTSGHITGNMVKTDSYRFTNNHIAFAKNDYNNNMMNGCNWDWQYCNLVNVKVYPVSLSLPTIDESTIQTVRETQQDTLSQIKFPTVRELSVEETAPSIDISDVTNKEEITTNGDVDLIKLVYLLVKDVQGLKSEVDSLKQENNELKLLLNKGE